MSAALCLLVYGAALVWMGPRLLSWLSRGGGAPRLSVVLWLVTIVIAIAAWLVGAVGMLAEVFGPHPAGPLRYCMDALLALNHLGWAGHVAIIVACAAALIATSVVARRSLVAVRRFWRRSREHAHAAHILGSPSTHPGVVVLQERSAAAYCVVGRPDAIVVTSAAMSTLNEAELAAVLAHERAHLAGRHPQLMMALRALATSMPRFPLLPNAVAVVGRLLEMCADDTAARRHGRETVLDGLIALAGAPRTADGALGAADTAVLARAERLAVPAVAGALLRERIATISALAAVVLAPVLIAVICHS
ncbi:MULTISPECIES: M56 family metallopeptidase [Mycobacteriaceae]|uniref:M56 family metallopeptidase n=1 Tax=Mycolicibacterium iranicum TaxID=912594 RepID=A0A178LZJ7_MYCIR|nr:MULTISPECIES: M56 family metallopeptidase [Mycolicibacterium]MCZ0731850.1 M56 family metallopeptidase [Mycolicibacterium iranicum]MDA2894784.1 M56 family metallopeptidase [Mycolicibacterium sp. BiH015]OAN40387.1 hypothetical protein A4X20_14905 [Mycolicibacterium iranicum]ORV80999.1 hypothetical protein AWC12_29840 [Mycolicibacterium iranicum]SPX90515.1 peptidase M48, Ste24p [Mycolicibacterium chubuense]